MEIEDIFTKHGHFKRTEFDPHRDENYEEWKILFDDDGGLRWEAQGYIEKYIRDNHKIVHPLSDMVVLLISSTFASNTKGHYSVTYYWR